MTKSVSEQLRDSIDSINQKLKDFETQFKIKAQNIFYQGCEIIFNAYPEVDNFGWIQYTPYFNDGDECTFGVNADIDYGLRINGYNADGDCEGLGYDPFKDGKHLLYTYGELKTDEDVRNNNKIAIELNSTYYMKIQNIGARGLMYVDNYDAHAAEIVNNIHNFITGMPEEQLKLLFGDHCEVTINKLGPATITDYDHD